VAFNNPKPRASSTGKPDRGGMDTLIRAEKMTQIAFILPAAVLVGWLVGAGLDKWLHTSWIYIVGILLGVAAGFVQIFRLVGAAGASIDRSTASTSNPERDSGKNSK
jgi:F0F1-type ATP synthase assembly protein I